MATVVTVHGTFAHARPDATDGAAQSPRTLQWWQAGSDFESDMRALVDATGEGGGAQVEVTRFEWSGDNSEMARRQAGERLLGELKALEDKGEPYCVVGHSHGGSVIGWALLESAARKVPLTGLKRWITVGAPFVSMKKERLLFQRLDLMHKVIFVASVMLVGMFLFYLVAELLSGGRRLFGGVFPAVLVFTGLMMSLPVAVFYLILKYLDSRSLNHYRRAVKERAAAAFGSRWRAFTHTDDEAVQGLAFLPGAKLYFFEKSFAVQALTMLSVVALPLLYLLAISSPTLMVGLGDWLKSNIYTAEHSETEDALRKARERIRALRKQQEAAGIADRGGAWVEYRKMRQELAAKYPDVRAAERAIRFKQRFFEDQGKPCPGDKICGAGHDLRINSGLILHLVTDELSSAVAGDGSGSFIQRSIWTLVIPAVVVPVLFGLLSLAIMLLIRSLALLVSDGASKVLNTITNNEVKRAAFGNDTNGEIAVGAVDRPSWIERSQPRLPATLADTITNYSNGVAGKSLAKFRQAIGQLASAEPKHTADSAITTYFTWKELVHASYFDVPEFRKLIALTVSRAEGFAPSVRLLGDPDHARAAQWLAEIEGTPGTVETPSAKPPSPTDAGAVSAVVASTVKAEP